ncbi:hemolysin III family protein [Egicoccus sp. AB-alg6-2]|uniref:PAQR family membrane homeostasis protein TrhA n=1 Tax=Egicoccus sp. AB-alg6-2 TaxID=3242692 RepID=UPI00359ED913
MLGPRPRLRGWIHGAAAPAAVVTAAMLWQAASPGLPRVSIAVFGVFLVGLYLVSSVYHVPPWPEKVRTWLARVDVAMIQLFIAASFTPFAVHALGGAWRTWSLVVAWSIAIVGAGVAISPAKGPRWLTVAAYASFGSLAAIPLLRVAGVLSPAGLALVVAGGLIYVGGGVIYARQGPNPWPAWFGFHEVFHVMVVVASGLHVVAIWRYAIPLA